MGGAVDEPSEIEETHVADAGSGVEGVVPLHPPAQGGHAGGHDEAEQDLQRDEVPASSRRNKYISHQPRVKKLL